MRAARAACRSSACGGRRCRAPRRRRAGAAARSARSLSDTMQPIMLCATVACGRGGEPLVHRAALVGLDVAERDPAQRSTGTTRDDRVGHQREHRRGSRCGTAAARRRDEVLVEAEVHLGDVRRELVDAVGDLGDSCLHQNGTSWVSRPAPSARPERIRQNSTASSVISSPPSPCVNAPPAGPVSVERERPAVAPRPLGDDVGDDAAVVLGGQHQLATGRAGDVDAVHPRVAREDRRRAGSPCATSRPSRRPPPSSASGATAPGTVARHARRAAPTSASRATSCGGRQVGVARATCTAVMPSMTGPPAALAAFVAGAHLVDQLRNDVKPSMPPSTWPASARTSHAGQSVGFDQSSGVQRAQQVGDPLRSRSSASALRLASVIAGIVSMRCRGHHHVPRPLPCLLASWSRGRRTSPSPRRRAGSSGRRRDRWRSAGR